MASANAQGFHVVGCMSIQGSSVYVLASVLRRYSDSRAYPIGYREEDFRARAASWETSELKPLYFSLINHKVVIFEEVKFRKFDVLFYVQRAYPYIFYRITVLNNNFVSFSTIVKNNRS